MIVSCENCQTHFKIPDEKIPEGGSYARCSNCKITFWLSKEGARFELNNAESSVSSMQQTGYQQPASQPSNISASPDLAPGRTQSFPDLAKVSQSNSPEGENISLFNDAASNFPRDQSWLDFRSISADKKPNEAAQADDNWFDSPGVNISDDAFGAGVDAFASNDAFAAAPGFSQEQLKGFPQIEETAPPPPNKLKDSWLDLPTLPANAAVAIVQDNQQEEEEEEELFPREDSSILNIPDLPTSGKGSALGTPSKRPLPGQEANQQDTQSPKDIARFNFLTPERKSEQNTLYQVVPLTIRGSIMCAMLLASILFWHNHTTASYKGHQAPETDAWVQLKYVFGNSTYYPDAWHFFEVKSRLLSSSSSEKPKGKRIYLIQGKIKNTAESRQLEPDLLLRGAAPDHPILLKGLRCCAKYTLKQIAKLKTKQQSINRYKINLPTPHRRWIEPGESKFFQLVWISKKPLEKFWLTYKQAPPLKAPKRKAKKRKLKKLIKKAAKPSPRKGLKKKSRYKRKKRRYKRKKRRYKKRKKRRRKSSKKRKTK